MVARKEIGVVEITGGELLLKCFREEGVRYIFGIIVGDGAAVLGALWAAVRAGQPAVVQVMVDQIANVAPPGLLLFGSMVFGASD